MKAGRGGRRRLGFAEFGPADGRPLVWLHGTPGARRQIPQSARVMAEELGIRIVGIDRPGVGSSTPYRYGSLLDSVTDLTRVADDLGLERFGVIGLSGGGPYALAASYALPDRVPVAAVLGGVAPTRGDDAPPGGFVGRVAPLGPLASVFLVPNVVGADGIRVVGTPGDVTGVRAVRPHRAGGRQKGVRSPRDQGHVPRRHLERESQGHGRPHARLPPLRPAVGLLRSRHHRARTLVARRRRQHRALGPRRAHGVAHPRRRALRSTGREPSRRIRGGRGGAGEVDGRLGRTRVGRPQAGAAEGGRGQQTQLELRLTGQRRAVTARRSKRRSGRRRGHRPRGPCPSGS